jgi:energy-coupling factor transport system permease protein
VIGTVPTYRRTGSALHATRPGVAIAFCAACGTPAVLFDSPLVLAAALACVIGAGVAAGVAAELARAARLGIPLALLVMLINPLVSQQGLTVLIEGPVVPVLGNVDVTLEALVFGAVSGLRVLVLIEVFALYSACVDPDDVLRLVGRVAPRSALTVSLATRTVPTLGRDAARLTEAYGLRAAPAGPLDGGRSSLQRAATLVRALAAGALERSVDLAAALEVRGYGGARRLARRELPWSRHDLSFAFAGLAIVLVAAAGRLAGLCGFEAYPLLDLSANPVDVTFAALLPVLALVPFAVAIRTRWARV